MQSITVGKQAPLKVNKTELFVRAVFVFLGSVGTGGNVPRYRSATDHGIHDRRSGVYRLTCS